jgi:NitT/TauT family transport system permease protein
MKRFRTPVYSKTLYGSLIVILFWYMLHLALNSPAIPSPYNTFLNFIKILPELSIHLLVSMGRISSAVIISLVCGSFIGLWIGINEKADGIISPIVYILYPLPKIAFLPVLMLIFGLGNTPKIMLIIIIIIFQFIIAAKDGVREIPKELFYSVISLGLNREQIYIHLIIPAVLPKIITALRISVGVSISVLFFGENFATTYGIGYFIMNSYIMANYVDMFSGILSLSITGLLIFKFIDLLENKFCIWVKIANKKAL